MFDNKQLCRAVVDNRHALEPIATDVQPELKVLPGVRAVIFDIYGTLVVSGSGDVGSANEKDPDKRDPSEQMADAFAAIGVFPPVLEIPTYGQRLRDIIHSANDARRNADCPHPEVDIVAIWRQMLVAVGLHGFANDTLRVVQLAAQYESRANPTWPMPGAKGLLSQLRESEMSMGIVSNAQQFTLPLVADLGDGSGPSGDLASVGFNLNLCFFSNRFRQSKPGPRLFDGLIRGLKRMSIQPSEAVYVGNDMLNDVYAASQAGLRTAWFAGDVRSCRPRSENPLCQTLKADVVLTQLTQLRNCLAIESP
ncbi:MAG: HAD family hydrolase [Pirellulaceae bacterium]